MYSSFLYPYTIFIVIMIQYIFICLDFLYKLASLWGLKINNSTNSHVPYIIFSPRSTAFLSSSPQKIVQLQEEWPISDRRLGAPCRLPVLAEPQLLCFSQRGTSTDSSWHSRGQEGTWGWCSAGFQGNSVWLLCRKWGMRSAPLSHSTEKVRGQVCA